MKSFYKSLYQKEYCINVCKGDMPYNPTINDDTIKNINNGIKKELPETILNKIKIFHLRGGIDYNKLNFMHKTMMKLLYTKAKSIKEENKTEEIKDLIDTYNKQIDFTNFSSLDKIITEIDKIKT